MKSSTFLLALIIGLSGCDNQSADNNTSFTQDDSLIPPAQPTLMIEAEHELLLFSWQTDRAYLTGSLYEYDQSTGIETLIHADITAQTNSLSLSGNAPSRAWHAQQFRLELCDATDCYSSDRTPIDTLLAATAQTLRPSVFLRGERFADSITANFDASVVASTLPIEGAIQIHFHNQTQWIATEPVDLSLADSHALLDVSSSFTGDTLAALIKDDNVNAPPGSIRIVERLGEAWLPVNDIILPVGITLNSHSIVQLSANADQVYLHTPKALLIYHRSTIDWSLQPAVTVPSETIIAATSINPNSDLVYALLQQSDALWLVTYQLVNDLIQPLWRESHRQMIQGVDANDDVFLQRNTDDSILIIAGWDSAMSGERSPVLWRYNMSNDAANSTAPVLVVNDSLRMAPTLDSNARLRFSVNENLDTAVLGWHSETGDDAQLSTFTFSEQQRYTVALELPTAINTLAKQSFGHDVVLSEDGQTLLVSTMPGSSTPASNQAGELLIFR